MQRDLKVGLSLGVLVLGVVGALLFRREPASDAPHPTLKTARKIDERIAERPRTPYMTGDVEFDQDDSNDKRDAHGKPAGNGRPDHAVAPSWLNEDEDPFQITKADHDRFDARNPGGAGLDAVVPLQSRGSATGHRAQSTPPVLQTHVIQSGDSLSALAGRYLGNQGRFHEIYEANRDILTDVNRLPLGATIVIPSETKAAGKQQAAAQPSGTTARTSLNQKEKVRSTITDISTIEPIAPPSAGANPETSAIPADKVASDTNLTASTAPPAKLHETKKFFTPSRLPFANHNGPVAPAPRRKTATQADDATMESKPAATSQTALSTTAEPRYYQVRKGDSLDRISTKVYGNSKRAPEIFAANRTLLASPDALREGQELVLPE